jgi:hypothetical protein
MRNIKMLGLLAVAAMAMVAFVGTTSAAAEKPGTFTTGGPGEELQHTELENHVLSFTGSELDCETIDFNGTSTGASAAEMSVTPVYSNCESFGFAEAEVHENNCTFRYKATTTGTPGHATVLLHNCIEKTKGIQITVHVPFFATCVVDIPEQSIDTAVRYTNVNAKSVRVDWTASKIMFDVTTSTGFCPLTTGTHSGANGANYKGASTFTTTNGIQYSPVE